MIAFRNLTKNMPPITIDSEVFTTYGFIITPFQKYGSIMGFMEKASKMGLKLPYNLAIFFFCGSVIALKQLYENGLSHCDFKGDNVVLGGDF